MKWEELTARDFEQAVNETGVCVLSLGVLERHSAHLPLGTDVIVAHAVASRAAEREPAVVFPAFYFGQIYEARCFPGTLTIRPGLLLELVRSVLDEIGRNGFKKIVVYNGHGGNNAFLDFIAQTTLWEPKPYSVYVYKGGPDREKVKALMESDFDFHAGEVETSITMALRPDLVDMGDVLDEPADPLNRLDHLPPTMSGVAWYANHPEHYAGDARAASIEKGQAIVDLMVESFAAYIAAVKADEVMPALEAEFFRRVEQVSE